MGGGGRALGLGGGGGRRGAAYDGLGTEAGGMVTLLGIQMRRFWVAPEDEPTSRWRFSESLCSIWAVSTEIALFTMVAKLAKS